MLLQLVLAIELGDFSLGGTSLADLLWFMAGVLALTGLTAAMIFWYRRAEPDPFAPG
jgi:hypothetical protein